MTVRASKQCIVFTIFYFAMNCQCGSAKDEFGLDMFVTESAIDFTERWLVSPTFYVNIILPTNRLFKMGFVSKMKKIVRRFTMNSYFMFSTNLTGNKNNGLSNGELFWFPFKIENYNIDCNSLDFSDNHTSKQNHYLFFTGTKKNVEMYFQRCKLRFDSNIVVYHRNNNSTDPRFVVQFEEIYKIEAEQGKLKKNALGQVDLHSRDRNFSGLDSYIWKRRSNLEGITFNAVTELDPPGIQNVEISNKSNGERVFTPTGYYPDLMKHLMFGLNFSLTNTLSKNRHNWTFLTESVRQGKFDIGYTKFTFDLTRSDMVDFSYGITPITFSIFYVKHTNDLRLEVFIRSFRPSAWRFLGIYVIMLISGLVVVSFMIETRTEASILKQISTSVKKSTNFVLRSLIGKRMSSEPDWYSTKIIFIFLVLAGFLVITAYRAVLVAFVTIQVDKPPVTSLSDLRKSNYLLAVRKYTAMEQIFRNAAPGSEEYKMHKSNQILHFTGDLYEYIDRMLDDKDEAFNTVLYYFEQTVHFSKHYPCTITDVKNYQEKTKLSEGMIFPKNWQFSDFFNYHLLVMKETGMMDRLFEPYVKMTKKSCPGDQTIRPIIQMPKPVGTNTTFTLYLLFFIGMVAAFFFLLIEILYQRYH